MRTALRLMLVLVIAALLLVSGCVELRGQRITIKYDAATDVTTILICYDGVHESVRNDTKGEDQIPTFVAKGEVMLVDWWGHIELDRKRDDATPTEAAVWESLRKNMTTRAAGHFRDADGAIGGVQVVTIKNTKEVLKAINAAISENVIKSQADGDAASKRTLEKLAAAAKAGHQWITMEGNAPRVTLPMDEREWAAIKARGLKSVVEDLRKHITSEVQAKHEPPLGPAPAQPDEAATNDSPSIDSYIRAITAAPISIEESKGVVKFTIGDPAQPTTLRFSVRERYNPTLEKALTQAVPENYDNKLADALLAEKPDAAAKERAELSAWGPAEDAPRALLRVASDKDDARRAKAIDALNAWAKKWNTDRGTPDAPVFEDVKQFDAEKWREWLKQMAKFPLHDADAKPAE